MTPTDWQSLNEERLDRLEARVDKMYELLVKLEGAGTLIKIIFWVVAPLVGAVVWLKDHVRL